VAAEAEPLTPLGSVVAIIHLLKKKFPAISVLDPAGVKRFLIPQIPTSSVTQPGDICYRANLRGALE
ncbi:MAG: hypothetical protein ABSH16_07605, partial [Sedimentisphaerales bacterium]